METYFLNKVYCEECGRVLTISLSQTKNGIVNYLKCSSCDTRGKNKVVCSNKFAIRYNELKDIVSLFIQDEIYNNIDFNSLETIYEKQWKNKGIDIHRKYLKQERELLRKEIILFSNEIINGTDLIAELKKKEKEKLLKLYNNRLDEIEILLKEIYSFARTKSITNKELYLDKYVIDTFVEKIIIGLLIGSIRKIDIVLK